MSEELRKCTCCKKHLLIANFDTNEKQEIFKYCNACRTKGAEYTSNYRARNRDNTIECSKCHKSIAIYSLKRHMHTYACITHGVDPKPDFNEWLRDNPEEQQYCYKNFAVAK